MVSTFTWIDHSESERRRMLDAIELFRERGTRDELGLSSVRDAFADLMFPGTGSLQTRARYFFFIPWMYQRLEAERVSSAEVQRRARQFEVKLINALAESSDTSGVIGIQKGPALQRLPSSIYWSGMRRLGMRLCQGSQDDYHRSLDEVYSHGRRAVKNDDGETLGAVRNWRSGIPVAPASFPDVANLQLSDTESEYMRERILTETSTSLLAFLVGRIKTETDIRFVWDHPLAAELPGPLSTQVHHARVFAEVMHGASILYNHMLARMEPRREQLMEGLNEHFDAWRGDVMARAKELHAWNRREFWELLDAFGARITTPTRQFIDAWVNLVLEVEDVRDLLGSTTAADLITARERRLKRTLARLTNQQARERWNGNSGLGRLEYRWRNAEAILNDMVSAQGDDARAT